MFSRREREQSRVCVGWKRETERGRDGKSRQVKKVFYTLFISH